jgi:transposase
MDQGFSLDDESRIILEEFHGACLDKKTADKIKAILLISQGFTYQQIQKILLIDERTLARYKKIYQERGIDGLVENNYQGSNYKLSGEQIKILKEELKNNLYTTAESVCEYVWKRFHIKYTAQGMVKTLHRIGFSYKKARTIPGNIDKEKQERFIKNYKRRYKHLKNDEKIYFMDGRIHIVLDNARYQHTKGVKETARELNIHLIYLPAYSPNLNFIERYWGFLNKKVLANKYYETYDIFKEAIVRFTRSKSKSLKESLQRYIPEKFHLIEPLSA